MNTEERPPRYVYFEGHRYMLMDEVAEMLERCREMDARARADLPLVVEGGIGSTHLGKLARPVR